MRKANLIPNLTLLICLLLVSGVSVPARAQDSGVINTNFPQPGGTTASAAIRLFPPVSYGSYSNMETDPAAVTSAERDTLLAMAQKEIPAGIGLLTLNAWADAKEGLNNIQVVNNMPIQGATYTVVLPANWHRSAKVPILLSGNGAGVSNNQRLWKQGDTSLIHLVGVASGAGHTGLIAAYSNAGGTESQGVDDHTYKSVGAFFDFMAQNGGDPQHAVTAGGSRGGGTALMWAINPLSLNYTVQAVFADIPPTAYGLLSQRSVLTYPNLGYIYIAAFHDPNAYLYSNPNGPGKPHVAALIGTDDQAAADAKSPIGMAEKLNGKVLVIGRGTHDPFFPLREFVAFDHRLNDLGILHSTVISLGQGHIGNTFLAQQLGLYIDALTQGKSYQPPSGRFLYINLAPPDGTQVPLNAFLKDGLAADPKTLPTAGLDLPFAAEIPAQAGVGLPVDLAFCGTPNSTYSYAAQDANGKEWTKGDGKLDASECAHAEIKAPDLPGEYHWMFTYNGKPISTNYTPRRNEGGCGAEAVTTVTQNQPTPADLNAGEPSLGFGVDQYSAQEASCTAK